MYSYTVDINNIYSYFVFVIKIWLKTCFHGWRWIFLKVKLESYKIKKNIKKVKV